MFHSFIFSCFSVFLSLIPGFYVLFCLLQFSSLSIIGSDSLGLVYYDFLVYDRLPCYVGMLAVRQNGIINY